MVLVYYSYTHPKQHILNTDNLQYEQTCETDETMEKTVMKMIHSILQSSETPCLTDGHKQMTEQMFFSVFNLRGLFSGNSLGN